MTSRSLFLIAAVISMLLPGCGTSKDASESETQMVTPPEKIIRDVSITYAQDGGQPSLTIDSPELDTITLVRGAQQVVQWQFSYSCGPGADPKKDLLTVTVGNFREVKSPGVPRNDLFTELRPTYEIADMDCGDHSQQFRKTGLSSPRGDDREFKYDITLYVKGAQGGKVKLTLDPRIVISAGMMR